MVVAFVFQIWALMEFKKVRSSSKYRAPRIKQSTRSGAFFICEVTAGENPQGADKQT